MSITSPTPLGLYQLVLLTGGLASDPKGLVSNNCIQNKFCKILDQIMRVLMIFFTDMLRMTNAEFDINVLRMKYASALFA